MLLLSFPFPLGNHQYLHCPPPQKKEKTSHLYLAITSTYMNRFASFWQTCYWERQQSNHALFSYLSFCSSWQNRQELISRWDSERELFTTTTYMYLLQMSPQYGKLQPTNGWDRFGSLGTPANFNGFRVLASLLQRRHSLEANHTLHDVWLSPCAKFTLRPESGVLLYWQCYCTALDQRASAKSCGVLYK